MPIALLEEHFILLLKKFDFRELFYFKPRLIRVKINQLRRQEKI